MDGAFLRHGVARWSGDGASVEGLPARAAEWLTVGIAWPRWFGLVVMTFLLFVAFREIRRLFR
jgi:hypothetical protein